MKKKYVTPMIAVEHYELTQTIAACTLPIGLMDRMCVLKDNDATGEMKNMAASNWFTQGEDGCIRYVIAGKDENGICYHTNTNAAFAS